MENQSDRSTLETKSKSDFLGFGKIVLYIALGAVVMYILSLMCAN